MTGAIRGPEILVVMMLGCILGSATASRADSQLALLALATLLGVAGIALAALR